MPTSVIEHIRRVVGDGLRDGELLGRSSIAATRRPWPPWSTGTARWCGACAAACSSHHDAEDAFQATFIVLVRKAASIAPREMVGNWLYGVAHQAALQAGGPPPGGGRGKCR